METLVIYTKNMVEFGISNENLISATVLEEGYTLDIGKDVRELQDVMAANKTVVFERVLDDSPDIIRVVLRPGDYFYTAMVKEVKDANEEKDSE